MNHAVWLLRNRMSAIRGHKAKADFRNEYVLIFFTGKNPAPASNYVKAVIKRRAPYRVHKYARSRTAIVIDYIYFVAEDFRRIPEHGNALVGDGA